MGWGLRLGMSREMEEGTKSGNGSIGKTKIIQGPLIDASEMHSPGGHRVIPLLLGMLPAWPHPSQINGCFSTQETTSCGHTVQSSQFKRLKHLLKAAGEFNQPRSEGWRTVIEKERGQGLPAGPLSLEFLYSQGIKEAARSVSPPPPPQLSIEMERLIEGLWVWGLLSVPSHTQTPRQWPVSGYVFEPCAGSECSSGP